MKKVLISIFIFIIAGELMIRFDRKFTIFKENRVARIRTDIEITPEYNMMKNNSISMAPSTLRIMVLGDSYIHGWGVEFKDNFSQQLKALLNNYFNNVADVFVLDVSKVSANNFDTNQTYFQFRDKVKPHIVILGYNINDIEGDLDKEKQSVIPIGDFKKIKSSGEEEKTVIRKVYKIIYKSRLSQFILHNLHNQMKAHGIIFPNSRFDIMLKSYYQNKANWKKSKLLLQEIIEDANKNDSQLIICYFPEFNLLEHSELFIKANDSIETFFKQFESVLFFKGSDALKGEKSKEYVLSKYDGHPNNKGHRKMAIRVFEIIKKTKHAEYIKGLK